MSRNKKLNKRVQKNSQNDGLAEAVREAQESRVPASQKSHIPSPADLGLEWHDSEETSGSNRIVFQPSVDEKVIIDDGVINKFDIRKLRMALMVLAESGTDMSGLVFIAPGNSSPMRERNRYLFIERSFHNKNELITLVALCKTQSFHG